MLQPQIIATRIAKMNEWAKTAQAEAFETHTAYCNTLSNEVVNDASWWNVFESSDVNSDQTRCKDNIDTAGLINEVAGVTNKLALATTEEGQIEALNKFYQILINLNTPRGEDGIARAPKAVEAWYAYEAGLDKETKRELGTSKQYEKNKKRKEKLFKGKMFSLAGGLTLGLIVGMLTGGK